MTVLMFQDRFAELVRTGKKPHTIRPERKRPIHVGDHLSLRRWIGKPYRSKQQILMETVCVRVTRISLGIRDGRCGASDEVLLGDEIIDTPERAKLSRADGFSCMSEMLDWFENTHGLPFHGVLIEWVPALVPEKPK